MFGVFNNAFALAELDLKLESWSTLKLNLPHIQLGNLRGCLVQKKMVTHHSVFITHHSTTHFLSPNNEEISHSARLAPKT